jgi:hypothetical protein
MIMMANLRRCSMVLLLMVLTICALSAQDVDFSGYGATGFRILEREALIDANQEVYYEGKLQADIKVSRLIEAQLDFRGDSRDKSVELREFTAKLELGNRLNLKIGHTKKPFGLEQMFDRYELETVDDSYLYRNISVLGYGGRAVSLMLYDKFAEKDSDVVPRSYYATLYKDNSQNAGVVGRIGFHLAPEWTVSGSAQMLSRGGRDPITTFGGTVDLSFESERLKASVEGVVAGDPVETIRRRMLGASSTINAVGANLNASMNFETGGELLRSIEPLILLGWYVPDSQRMSARTIQAVAGVNLHVHKRALIRVNVDRLDTRAGFSTVSSTHDSRVTFEFQVRY